MVKKIKNKKLILSFQFIDLSINNTDKIDGAENLMKWSILQRAKWLLTIFIGGKQHILSDDVTEGLRALVILTPQCHLNAQCAP